MTMYKALYTRNDIERFYVLRKEIGRGFASIEVCVGQTIRKLKEFTKINKERSKGCSQWQLWPPKKTVKQQNLKKQKCKKKAPKLYRYFKWQIGRDSTWNLIDLANKVKPPERNLNSANSSTKWPLLSKQKLLICNRININCVEVEMKLLITLYVNTAN